MEPPKTIEDVQRMVSYVAARQTDFSVDPTTGKQVATFCSPGAEWGLRVYTQNRVHVYDIGRVYANYPHGVSFHSQGLDSGDRLYGVLHGSTRPVSDEAGHLASVYGFLRGSEADAGRLPQPAPALLKTVPRTKRRIKI